tara:strand:+ start:140 stop:265 length:126 start_codon:yes stop_codon:yes gene_type:complete
MKIWNKSTALRAALLFETPLEQIEVTSKSGELGTSGVSNEH